MTRKSLFPTVLCILLLSANAAAAAQDLSGIVQKTLPGVVVVYALDSKGDYAGHGSGSFVTDQGDVLTNQHVAKQNGEYYVQTDDGAVYPAKLRAYDVEWDMALLATNVPPSKYKVLPISSQVAPVGTGVFALGAPRGYPKSVSDGLVSQLRNMGGGVQYLQVSCPISPGSSGGPVLNLKGQIIGMATLMRIDAQNLNFAVPSPALKTFVERARKIDASRPQRFSSPPSSSGSKQSPNSAPAERHVYIGEEKDMDNYLDTRSVKQQGYYVRFRIQSLLDEDLARHLGSEFKLKTGPETMQRDFEINFYRKQIRNIQNLLLDKDGKTLHKETPMLRWDDIKSGSPAQDWYDHIALKYYKKR